MGDVLWNLDCALQLQEASSESLLDENSRNYIPDIPDCIPCAESAYNDDADVVGIPVHSSFKILVLTVLSLLIHPKGSDSSAWRKQTCFTASYTVSSMRHESQDPTFSPSFVINTSATDTFSNPFCCISEDSTVIKSLERLS